MQSYNVYQEISSLPQFPDVTDMSHVCCTSLSAGKLVKRDMNYIDICTGVRV